MSKQILLLKLFEIQTDLTGLPFCPHRHKAGAAATCGSPAADTRRKPQNWAGTWGSFTVKHEDFLVASPAVL